MKNLIISLFFVIGVVVFTNANTDFTKKEKTKTVTMEVGFHCAGGKAAIESKLSKAEGVVEYSVDLQKKTVTVTYNIKETDREKIAEIILGLGYSVDGKSPKEGHKCGH